MPNVLIFGTSLDPNSKSQVLAREVAQRLAATPTPHALVDLRTLQLPESGRPGATDHPEVAALRNQVSRATHLVFAVAIYNYSVSSAAKNLVELLTDEVMNDKVVGFLCAAGGRGSYMAVMSLANSLMLDFRSWVVPRFVYAVGRDFENGALLSKEIHQRLDQFVATLLAGPSR